MSPVQSCKPAAQAVKSDGPISDKTTHRLDFVPHPLEKPHVHQHASYKQPEGDIDATTMYQKDYTEKRGLPVKPIRREMKRASLGKFEGEPTYRADYRQWEMPRFERHGTSLSWCPPKEAFEGLPTYTSDYPAHRVAPPAPFKPDARAAQSSAPFDGQTDYRQSYVPHPLEVKRAKEKAMWNRPAVPFEGLSTFTRDYTPKEGGKMASCKPLAEAFRSDGPLASDTTNRLDFKPWAISKPFHHEHAPYQRPEGDFDFGTTYHKDYPQHAMIREAKTRPASRTRDPGPFEGTTNYTEAYRVWQVAPRKSAGPNQDYQGPCVPFEGQSTHQAHFVPHQMDLTRSFKPDARAAQSNQPFEDATMYRTEFVPKAVSPCPAAILDTKTSRFTYREQDQTGHKFYEPLQTTLTDLRNGATIACS